MRIRPLLGTIVAVTLPVLAIVALHRFGSLDWLRIDFGDLRGWARQARIEDAFAAVLRYVALAGAYWLAASSLLYLLARLSGIARLIDATSVLTLPAVRRVTDRLVVGTLAMSTFAGPAIAVSSQFSDGSVTDPVTARLEAEVPADEDLVIDLTDVDESELERLVPQAELPHRSDDQEPRPRSNGSTDAPPSISVRAAAHLEVVVTEGDHLWGLAERRVSSVLGRPAADHEIAPYWREVISSNPEIRSGDPDVIYPGEVIVLPPLD
jgi:hypothetical protein